MTERHGALGMNECLGYDVYEVWWESVKSFVDLRIPLMRRRGRPSATSPARSVSVSVCQGLFVCFLSFGELFLGKWGSV